MGGWESAALGGGRAAENAQPAVKATAVRGPLPAVPGCGLAEGTNWSWAFMKFSSGLKVGKAPGPTVYSPVEKEVKKETTQGRRTAGMLGGWFRGFPQRPLRCQQSEQPERYRGQRSPGQTPPNARCPGRKTGPTASLRRHRLAPEPFPGYSVSLLHARAVQPSRGEEGPRMCVPGSGTLWTWVILPILASTHGDLILKAECWGGPAPAQAPARCGKHPLLVPLGVTRGFVLCLWPPPSTDWKLHVERNYVHFLPPRMLSA